MADQPVFAFLAFTSGSYEGAILRDMRLANALHRRGFRVVVYWMMERNAELPDEGIAQRTLSCGMRFQFRRPSELCDRIGRLLRLLWPAWRRRRFMQQHPDWVQRLAHNFVGAICCEAGTADPRLAARLARFIQRDGVTHLMPTFAMLCPLAQAARRLSRRPFDYVATFQGEEIFANYAAGIGRLEDYHQRLREVVAQSPWPAIAVSRDYIGRLRDEMGIDERRLVAIYPGIELPPPGPRPAFEIAWKKLPGLRPDVPIVLYFGRQDAEKGIDLLLYAARMLQDRGVRMQLVACGGSSFGQVYRLACEQIAAHLRVHVYWKRRIPDDVRDALYAHARCVVYPSIHREPFGLVAAEAMSHGTPVLVPDYGGITEAIQWDGRAGGLTFRAWDTADLARQLERLLTDEALHARLSANARPIAEKFSVDAMTDRVLAHIGLQPYPSSFRSSSSMPK